MIAEAVPLISCQDHARLQPVPPGLRHENAVAVVRNRPVAGSPKRLARRLVGICRLPAIEEPELLSQPRLDRQVLFACRSLGSGTVAHGEIEVAADDDLSISGEFLDLVKQLVDLLPVGFSF